MKLSGFFEEDRKAVDSALDRLLPPESAPPASIHRAVRYSVFAGGKRLRPVLCLEAARIFDADITPALRLWFSMDAPGMTPGSVSPTAPVGDWQAVMGDW